jgi:hypothetical protein
MSVSQELIELLGLDPDIKVSVGQKLYFSYNGYGFVMEFFKRGFTLSDDRRIGYGFSYSSEPRCVCIGIGITFNLSNPKYGVNANDHCHCGGNFHVKPNMKIVLDAITDPLGRDDRVLTLKDCTVVFGGNHYGNNYDSGIGSVLAIIEDNAYHVNSSLLYLFPDVESYVFKVKSVIAQIIEEDNHHVIDDISEFRHRFITMMKPSTLKGAHSAVQII